MRGPDGTFRWFGGGRLHAALTLPRLRESWAHAYGGEERSGASRFTGPERAEIYRHAARQTAIAAEHLRYCTATDPDHGADPAWAVADALHAAARATGSRALRGAADTYDRASRSPHGRIPRHTPEGNQLRTAARLLAMTDGTSGGGIGPAATLGGNLVALIDAAAGLRQAQAHAAQAAAARTAAEQLHAALAAARICVRRPGQTPARSAWHAAAAAAFPLPLADVLAAAASTDSAEQRSTPQVAQPPARAGLLASTPRGLRPDRLPSRSILAGATSHLQDARRHCGWPPEPTLPPRQSRQAGALVTEREPAKGPR